MNELHATEPRAHLGLTQGAIPVQIHHSRGRPIFSRPYGDRMVVLKANCLAITHLNHAAGSASMEGTASMPGGVRTAEPRLVVASGSPALP